MYLLLWKENTIWKYYLVDWETNSFNETNLHFRQFVFFRSVHHFLNDIKVFSNTLLNNRNKHIMNKLC